MLCEIVTDNSLAFIKVLGYLAKHYYIHYICISGYNSCANGIAEQAHFNVWQAMFKACNGNQSKWHLVVTSVMWANHITVHQHMGCSPYFAVTGTHPLLPLDIVEATYLLPPPDASMTTTALISNHMIALQKQWTHLGNLTMNIYTAHVKAAVCFKQQHAVTITDYHFTLRDLVLIRNTAIEKSLNCKMHTRYLSLLIVISCNKGGAYIVAELDRAVFQLSYSYIQSHPLLCMPKYYYSPTQRTHWYFHLLSLGIRRFYIHRSWWRRWRHCTQWRPHSWQR